MTVLSVRLLLILWGIGCVLMFASFVLAIVYKKPGIRFFDLFFSGNNMLNNPERFISNNKLWVISAMQNAAIIIFLLSVIWILAETVT